MKRIILLTLAVTLGGTPLLLGGCARGGDEQPVVPEVVLEVMIRFARVVEDASYYYAAFDTDGDFGADGPLPVAAGPRWGNGWGTGSLTHFVEYHQGRYELFRTNLTPELTQAGGGVTAVAGVPDGTDAGVHSVTIDALDLGAATVDGAGMVGSAVNYSLQAAGTLTLATDAAGDTVARGGRGARADCCRAGGGGRDECGWSGVVLGPAGPVGDDACDCLASRGECADDHCSSNHRAGH